MARFTFIIFLLVHGLNAETFTIKRSPRRLSTSSLMQELCTQCSQILKISPRCIKKIIQAKDTSASKSVIAIIADVQSAAIEIIQQWADGNSPTMTREQIERAIIVTKEAHKVLAKCLQEYSPSQGMSVCNAGRSFIQSVNLL